MKAPWQYEWKRPTLNEFQSDINDDTCIAKGLTAALVDPLELNKLGAVTPLLLTVTLYSDDSGIIGNRILVRLIDPPSSELQSRELRWPGSMLDGAGEHDGGVVAVELCRKSNHTIRSAPVDALDVIHLMSLGIVDTVSMETTMQDNNVAEQQVEVVLGSDRGKDPDAGDQGTDLILACLTSNGRVHFYKALDLFQQSQTEDHSDDDMEVGLANLLFGNDIFHQIRDSLYPLSQPCGTVQLSVPLKRMERRKSKFKFASFLHPKPSQGSDVPLWDESFWNSTVEKSTAIYRTLNNVPIGMVAAFQYVAVYGRGSRTQRVRRKQHNNVVVLEGLEALQQQHDNDAKIDEWWQREGDTNNEKTEKDTQEPWWKAGAEEKEVMETIETGGFVTFIDLQHASETRTLYLPFTPKALYPLLWGSLAFVIVLADESTSSDHCAKAIAIRVDSLTKTLFDCGASPTTPADEELEMVSPDGKLVKKPMCEVRRFSLIPIMLPVDDLLSSTTIRSTSATSLLSSPPSVELLYSSPNGDDGTYDVALTLNSLHYFDLVPASDLHSYPQFAESLFPVLVIQTKQRMGNAARIPKLFGKRTIESARSRVFQGCSLFKIQHTTYFICWDGATEEEGAYVHELIGNDADDEGSNLNCTILQLEQSSKEHMELADELYVPATTAVTNVPSSDLTLQTAVTKNDEKFANQSTSIDDIVINALDSISSLSYRGHQSMLSPSNSPKVKRSERLSYLEKSQRLVQHCESWATLGSNDENRSMFESQVPVHLSIVRDNLQIFSLRHSFVRNGSASPFNQVLGWLSQREDYFTASSIALGLLRDFESWSDLRRLKNSGTGIDGDERENLEGILDGVTPLYPEGKPTLRPRHSVVSHVADMTIGCLAKGGFSMSTTLTSFLQRNKDYDPAKAALMLVAVATRCVSRDKETVNAAMGAGYEYSDESRPEDLLWALRSLLFVGVAKDQIPQAIVLVNVAMPDELRCRKSKSPGASSPPMALCKAVVFTIVSASPDAAALMLDLVDEESRKRYWASLSREAQLEFSLIDVDDRCPLLLQDEVRKWALDCLQECVTQEASPSAVNLNDLMPTEWLQRLCEGCLLNAECDYGRILTYGVSDVFSIDDEGTLKYISEFDSIQEALTASSTSCGLDYDLLIPALLILQQRDVTWNQEAVVTTQRILDAACYMAGRHRPTKFSFDGPRVLQQCAAASNVAAGANLVGGTNGLVLSCCDVLMKGTSLDMATAESYILDDSLSQKVLALRGSDQKIPLAMTDGHRQVLWLLSRHVLNVRTFGEFHPIHMRGKVNPVFAAQACLRTWWALSSSNESTSWLVNWLRRHLDIHDDRISPKRLACAALTRALMWPTSDQCPDVLATIMCVESAFLIQLAQSCHGLIESIPVSLADEIISRTDALSVAPPMPVVNFPNLQV